MLKDALSHNAHKNAFRPEKKHAMGLANKESE